MRKIPFIIVITAILLTIGNTYVSPQTQLPTYQELQDVFYFTKKKLDASRDSITILLDMNLKLKKINENNQSILKNDSIIFNNYEAQIQQFKDREAKVEIPPLFQWQGFTVGLSAIYPFEDSILTKTTVLNGLQYNIEGRAGVLIGQKFTFEGTIGVPLSKRKMWLKAFVGYKLF